VPSLQDLATNLANHQYYSGVGAFNANKLPFGRDTPGGGDSRQPFVVRKIDQRWSPSNFNDGLTQFGAVTTVTRTVADVERISKFLYTTIEGPIFLLKQTGLQRMNPDTEQLGNKVGPLRTYNPLGLTTLAQVGVSAAGIHFTKHGITPKLSDQESYQNMVIKRDKDNVNRLSILTRELSKDKDRYIDKYVGGPGSFFGIGDTTIRRYATLLNTQNADEKSGFLSVPVANLNSIAPTMFYSGVPTTRYIVVDPTKNRDAEGENYNRPPAGPADVGTNNYQLNSTQDFRSYKNALNKKSSPKGYELPESNYQTLNLENRIGVARVRTPEQRVDYTSEASTADRINAIGLYYAAGPAATATDVNGKPVNTEGSPESFIRDIIKFRIKILDNDVRPEAKGNNLGVYIVFRAYISNIRRNVVSKWDAYKYVGRGESFYAYDGFTETITYSFVIAASSRAEMKPLYQKLNYLISSMAPDYKDHLMRGNIAELTIGDFVLYQPGIITNFDMNIDEDSNWEIALQEPDTGLTGTDTDMHELPQLIKCNMTFIPIYNFLPRKSSEAPFIGIDGLSEKKEGKMWLKGTGDRLKEGKEKTLADIERARQEAKKAEEAAKNKK
jgi:hypothetical protein